LIDLVVSYILVWLLLRSRGEATCGYCKSHVLVGYIEFIDY